MMTRNRELQPKSRSSYEASLTVSPSAGSIECIKPTELANPNTVMRIAGQRLHMGDEHAAIDRAMKCLCQLKLAGQLRRPNLPELIGSNASRQLDGPSTVDGNVKE